MKKRLFSILLVLCMALTMLPVTALAEEVTKGTYDIAINGTKWKFERNESGEYIPVYYYKNYTFSTDANDKINKYYTNDNLVLTKEGDTVTISFRRGTGNQFYSNPVKFTIESKVEGSDISCIEMGNGNNLVITGEGTKGTLILTRNGKDGIGDALSSKEGNITITGGATVKVTFNKQKNKNVNGHAIFVDNHDLIISGAGTTVEAENQSCAPQRSSNDATVRVAGGKIIVSDGAWLKATNTFTNNNIDRYDYFSCAISGNENAPCTVSVTGEKSRITASAYNSTTYAGTSMGQAYRWADFQVTGAKIEVGNSPYPLAESTVEGITGHQYVTISIPTAPAPHTHTFGDTWTSDATDHWHACTASDCNAIKDKAAHSGGTATCTAKRVCTVCNQSYGEFDPNNHTHLSGWTSDATGHWKVCTDCNATDIDKDSHNYGEWQITQKATATEAGSQYRECSVCHYKETVTIPATGPCTHEGTLKYTDNGDWSTHKVECIACGQVINAKEAHAIHGYRINDVAGTHQEFCNKCSYNGPVLHHSNFIYVSDGDSHYKKCGICGVRTGMKEAHNFENGSCTACGAADPTYVPPTDPAPVEPTPGGSVIIITPEATGPVFLSGANQTVALGSAAAFRIDYNYAAFRSVAVDGVTLTPADYTTWEGSTWVKLTPAYVKTLGIGTHTLSVYFDGATATTTFTVGGQPNPATGARDAVGIAAATAVIALLGSAVILRKK